ncbi:MAG TPA: BamA/TamA family outer membrane protein [Saprospiraceae bacterium]|nr:BamA/TamA family outer membrane protein [Saprospiraceae bacterium]
MPYRITVVFFLFAFYAQGQLYPISLTSPDNKIIEQWVRDQPKIQDSISWTIARKELIRRLHADGFLFADIARWDFTSDTLYAVIYPNQIIRWAKMSFKALEFLPSHWVNDLDLSGEIVDYAAWRSTVTHVLESAQREGYLFADYRLNVIGLKGDSIEAEIMFEPGLQIVLDTIEIEGNAKISQKYLQRLVGIEKGDPVTPQDLQFLQQQFNNLRFVQQAGPPVLILIDGKATIRAYLNNRNASSFDVLAGLQPSSGIDRKLTLTGYVELDLVNQLTRGERLFFHLEKLRPRSQELEMSLAYPYLLDLPFGVEGEFRLMKNDTFYSDLEWKAGVALPLGKNQFIRAGVTQQATNIISVDKNRIISTKKLPAYLDLRTRGFTMGVSRNRLDFELNPRRGYEVIVDGSVSQRRIRENDLITGLGNVDTSFNYANLYDSLQDPSTRLAIEGNFQYFIPWGPRSTIRLALNAGALKSGEQIFTNEMFRLGGYQRLRGFDEESILAQYFSILTAEYRLFIGTGSYLSMFTDYGWVKNQDVTSPYEDRLLGLGIGINLETAAGIFGLRIAVGSQRNNPINLDNTRVHLGYVNRF